MTYNESLHFADNMLMVKEICMNDLPKGLSITWKGQLHLWPAAYRPAGETFDDTMRYTLHALSDNTVVTPDMRKQALESLKE